MGLSKINEEHFQDKAFILQLPYPTRVGPQRVFHLLQSSYSVRYVGITPECDCIYLSIKNKTSSDGLRRTLDSLGIESEKILPGDKLNGYIQSSFGDLTLDPGFVDTSSLSRVKKKPRFSKKRNHLIVHDNVYLNLSSGIPDPCMFHAVWSCREEDGLWRPMMWVGPSKNITPSSRKRVRPTIVSSLMKEQKQRCKACGTPVSTGDYNNCDVDHIIPLVYGGTNDSSNLQIVCVPCHRKKSSLECRRVSTLMSEPGVTWEDDKVYVTNTHVHYNARLVNKSTCKDAMNILSKRTGLFELCA